MNYQYENLRARIVGPDPNLRAADADREHVAERLRTSHAEGRLELTEFQERLERCYRAKTIGELKELVRDLPQERQVEQRPRAVPGSWRWSRGPLIPILIVVFVISAASGHGHHTSWLWIPILFVVWRMLWSRRGRPWTGGRQRHDDWI
jgi:Domain of unknown function (DUF1707)